MLEWGLLGFSLSLFGFGVAVVLAELGWVDVGVGTVATALFGSLSAWLYLTRRGPAAVMAREAFAQARLAERLAPELGSAPTSAVTTTLSD